MKFHNGDEMTAEDVVFSFGPERMFGAGETQAQGTLFARIPGQGPQGRELLPEVPAVARCRAETPVLKPRADGRLVACHVAHGEADAPIRKAA